MGSVQYESALAITRNVGGTSKEKFYHDLAFESLGSGRWYGKLSKCYKSARMRYHAVFLT